MLDFKELQLVSVESLSDISPSLRKNIDINQTSSILWKFGNHFEQTGCCAHSDIEILDDWIRKYWISNFRNLENIVIF